MNGDEFMTKIIVRKIKYSWIVKVILQFFLKITRIRYT